MYSGRLVTGYGVEAGRLFRILQGADLPVQLAVSLDVGGRPGRGRCTRRARGTCRRGACHDNAGRLGTWGTGRVSGRMGGELMTEALAAGFPENVAPEASPASPEASQELVCHSCGVLFVSEARLRGSPRCWCSARCRTRGWRQRRRAGQSPAAPVDVESESTPPCVFHPTNRSSCVWCKEIVARWNR